jgi:predicted amidohydrolase YtcJ
MISANLLQIAASGIKNQKVMQTYMRGKKVFDIEN